MQIKVFISTMQENHVLYANDEKENVVLLDAKKTNYDVDRFIFKIIDMSSNWPSELENMQILDGLEYKIFIKENEKVISYKFRNKFPENIDRLHRLINDVMGGN